MSEKLIDLGPWFDLTCCRHTRVTREDGSRFTTRSYCQHHLEELHRIVEAPKLKPQTSPCEYCGQPAVTDICESCCDHEFDASEGFTCINCGKDGYEEVAAAAFDRAKDLRKYGG